MQWKTEILWLILIQHVTDTTFLNLLNNNIVHISDGVSNVTLWSAMVGQSPATSNTYRKNQRPKRLDKWNGENFRIMQVIKNNFIYNWIKPQYHWKK